MKQDEMTICECVEYLDSMVGDDKNILECINHIEKKAKSMYDKLVQNKDEMFERLGYKKSNECTNPSYFKKDDPYAWINFSDTGVAISSQHELGYEHLDYELIKAIYAQMKELELIE